MMNAFKRKYIFIEKTEIKTIPPSKAHKGEKTIYFCCRRHSESEMELYLKLHLMRIQQSS